MGSRQSILEGAQTDYKTKRIHKIFEDRLNENSRHRTALFYHDSVTSDRETSFDTLNRRANRLAACILQHLQSINAKPNEDGDHIIAVCMTTNDNVITTLLAIWKAGAAYLPLEPTFPRNRVEFIVEESKPVLVIYDDDVDPNIFQTSSSISFNDLLSKSSTFLNENIHTQNSLSRSDEDIAIILYTSVSPKGKIFLCMHCAS